MQKPTPAAFLTGGGVGFVQAYGVMRLLCFAYLRPACSSRAGILDSQPRLMMWTPWQ